MKSSVRSAVAVLMPVAAVVLVMLSPGGGGTEEVGQRLLLDNAQVTVMEFVFPPGFRGEEHAAVAHEFAYVVEGEFVVVTRAQGKRALRPGEIEWAAKGTVHYSVNERRTPARVLVVMLK
jgi:quercetin dioxygenase-like cupin family protein